MYQLSYVRASVPATMSPQRRRKRPGLVTGLPAGMSFKRPMEDPWSLQIYGTPTVAGTYTVKVTVTNPLGSSTADVKFTVTKTQVRAPSILTTSLPDGTAGSSYISSYLKADSFGLRPTLTVTGLPPGIDVRSEVLVGD